MVSLQEWFLIKSGLWWRAYGKYSIRAILVYRVSIFPGNSYSQELEENMLTPFDFTIATDQNTEEGDSDIICYYLLNQTEYFQIPEHTENKIKVTILLGWDFDYGLFILWILFYMKINIFKGLPSFLWTHSFFNWRKSW